jgi:hypothetical protein
MHCHHCLSSESPLLLDDQNAKICKSCLSKLNAGHVLKSVVEIKEEIELNLGSETRIPTEAAKINNLIADVKTEPLPYQIVFLKSVIKEEPELQIDADGVTTGK